MDGNTKQSTRHPGSQGSQGAPTQPDREGHANAWRIAMRGLVLALEAVVLAIAALVCLGASLHAMMIHAPGWEIRSAAGIAGYLVVWAVGLLRLYPRKAELDARYEL